MNTSNHFDFIICVNVQMTHENIFDLVNSKGMSAKIVLETHHLQHNLMLACLLVSKHFLQTREGGLEGAHAPFRHLPH